MKKIVLATVLCICLGVCIFLGGCKYGFMDLKDESVVDYTVVSPQDLPEELKTQIDEQKSQVMKFSYSDNEYLYIVEGYGEQRTGGYSVSIVQVYSKGQVIYFDSKLEKPGKNENVNQEKSYPYIVIKMEKTDKTVVFDD